MKVTKYLSFFILVFIQQVSYGQISYKGLGIHQSLGSKDFGNLDVQYNGYDYTEGSISFNLSASLFLDLSFAKGAIYDQRIRTPFNRWNIGLDYLFKAQSLRPFIGIKSGIITDRKSQINPFNNGWAITPRAGFYWFLDRLVLLTSIEANRHNQPKTQTYYAANVGVRYYFKSDEEVQRDKRDKKILGLAEFRMGVGPKITRSSKYYGTNLGIQGSLFFVPVDGSKIVVGANAYYLWQGKAISEINSVTPDSLHSSNGARIYFDYRTNKKELSPFIGINVGFDKTKVRLKQRTEEEFGEKATLARYLVAGPAIGLDYTPTSSAVGFNLRFSYELLHPRQDGVHTDSLHNMNVVLTVLANIYNFNLY